MKSAEIIFEADKQLSNARSIRNKLDSETFRDVFDNLLKEEQQELLALVTNTNKEGVIEWLAFKIADLTLLESMSVRELRKVASRFGVQNYCTFIRIDLISEIKYYEQERSCSSSK